MTTDPVRHTGEGIFFTSRAFDTFEIYANQRYYLRDNRVNDWSVSSYKEKITGTRVVLSIQDTSHSHLVEITKNYQDPDTLAFNRTEIIVQLAKIGDELLMSRSQAKRIVLG